MLLSALLLTAATPLLMAPTEGSCVRCRVNAVFHERLQEDIAWREVRLAAGTAYTVDAERLAGDATVELVDFEGDVRSACFTFARRSTCSVAADAGGVLGIFIDSSTAESETVVLVLEEP